MTRYAQFVTAVMVTFTLAGCGEPTTNAPTKAQVGVETIHFSNARLIPGDGSPVIEDATFLVENGKITKVGGKGEIKIPQGSGVVDLEGQTIMPFVVNLHGHPGLNTGASFSPDNYNRESVTNDLKRYLYYGVGSVLALGTDKDDLALQIRAEQAEGKDPGARLFTAGRGITAKGGWPAPLLKDMPIQVATEAEARKAVNDNADKKVDFIKIWVDDNMGAVPKLKPELYKAIIDEAHKKNLKVVAHIFYLADAKDLVAAGIDGLTHSIRDHEVDDAFVAAMKAKNVFFTPTLTAHESKFIYADDPKWLGEQSMREAYPAMLSAYLANDVFVGGIKRNPSLPKFREQYAIALKNLKKIAAGGVTIGLGTDSGVANTFPGYFEHREMQLMADGGMSPTDIIKAATSVSAGIIGLKDGGSLTVGKKADFLVLTRDPLENIGNTKEIAFMYLSGSRIDRLPLIENIQTAVPRITEDDKKNERKAQLDDAIKKADAALPHYGKFPLAPTSARVRGMVIPMPKYSTNSQKAGSPTVITVSLGAAAGDDLKGFFAAALPKYQWQPAGGCFEKKDPVKSKTNALCVTGSGSSATLTITEK